MGAAPAASLSVRGPRTTQIIRPSVYASGNVSERLGRRGGEEGAGAVATGATSWVSIVTATAGAGGAGACGAAAAATSVGGGCKAQSGARVSEGAVRKDGRGEERRAACRRVGVWVCGHVGVWA